LIAQLFEGSGEDQHSDKEKSDAKNVCGGMESG